MDDESGESMEPMEEVPLEGPGESELGRHDKTVYSHAEFTHQQDHPLLTVVTLTWKTGQLVEFVDLENSWNFAFGLEFPA